MLLTSFAFLYSLPRIYCGYKKTLHSFVERFALKNALVRERFSNRKPILFTRPLLQADPFGVPSFRRGKMFSFCQSNKKRFAIATGSDPGIREHFSKTTAL
jgi:hypothetical protein